MSRLKEACPDCLDRSQFVKEMSPKRRSARIAETALNRFGRIDFLINNAGPYIFERKN